MTTLAGEPWLVSLFSTRCAHAPLPVVRENRRLCGKPRSRASACILWWGGARRPPHSTQKNATTLGSVIQGLQPFPCGWKSGVFTNMGSESRLLGIPALCEALFFAKLNFFAQARRKSCRPPLPQQTETPARKRFSPTPTGSSLTSLTTMTGTCPRCWARESPRTLRRGGCPTPRGRGGLLSRTDHGSRSRVQSRGSLLSSAN